MGNCLITKLKGVVDNDSLRRLGYVRIERFAGPLNKPVLICGSTDNTLPENFIFGHNATFTDQSGSAKVTYTNDEAWVDVKKEKLYTIKMYEGGQRGFMKLDLSELVGCTNINEMDLTGDFNGGVYGSIDNLVFPNITKIALDYNEEIVGSARDIAAHMPNLQRLYIAGTRISGSADPIVLSPSALRLPNLTVAEFHSGYITSQYRPTPIQFNVSNIVICANLGCKVYIHESQIVWDTMTKEQFLETYESLPTPPVFYPAS